jgi:hypothetical protein
LQGRTFYLRGAWGGRMEFCGQNADGHAHNYKREAVMQPMARLLSF